MIEREHGHKLAVDVSEWFIRTQPRTASGAQRMNLRERTGVNNDRVLRALAHMEANLEEPVNVDNLARIAGISSRQLERLFSKHLRATIGDTYLRIRLEHANALLRKTSMSVTHISVQCGFASLSHFSRSFKAMYGCAASVVR